MQRCGTKIGGHRQSSDGSQSFYFSSFAVGNSHLDSILAIPGLATRLVRVNAPGQESAFLAHLKVSIAWRLRSASAAERLHPGA
jgi:hypothetical protein